MVYNSMVSVDRVDLTEWANIKSSDFLTSLKLGFVVYVSEIITNKDKGI